MGIATIEKLQNYWKGNGISSHYTDIDIANALAAQDRALPADFCQLFKILNGTHEQDEMGFIFTDSRTLWT